MPLAAALAALGTPACARWGAAPALEPEPPAPAPASASPARDLPSVVLHTVRPGETLWRITRAYGADLDEVIVVNNLDQTARISTGQTLLIPAPRRLPPAGPLTAERAPAPPGGAAPEAPGALPEMSWPLHGAVQSRFGPRGHRHHDGIDIDGRRGDPIRAAAAGRVVFSGLRGAYGKTVILDHGEGIRTLYAHADELEVRRGERVKAGALIARVGRSGNAHGTHLHFELWIHRRPVDPLEHLPLESARAGSAR